MRKLFTLPFLFPTLNEEVNLLKKHWSIYASHKKAYQLRIIQELKKQLAGYFNPISGLLFVWRKKHKRGDLDGISAVGKKFILDALVCEGLIRDDSVRYVVRICDEFIGGAQADGVDVYLMEDIPFLVIDGVPYKRSDIASASKLPMNSNEIDRMLGLADKKGGRPKYR